MIIRSYYLLLHDLVHIPSKPQFSKLQNRGNQYLSYETIVELIYKRYKKPLACKWCTFLPLPFLISEITLLGTLF